MSADDWSALEQRLERRLRKRNAKKHFAESGRSVFMLKQIMRRAERGASGGGRAPRGKLR